MMSRNQAQAAANPQMRMMKYLAPLFTLVCIKFPAGVIVYYATSNICRIVQQDAMYRFDPKVKALVAQEVEEVEELTQEIDERQRNRPGYTPPRGAKPAAGAKPDPGAGGQTGGRSRFRDLLAAAAEQQRQQQQAKAGGNGSAKGGDRSGDRSGDRTRGQARGQARGSDGPGEAARGGSAGRPGGGQNRNRPQGSRTNRKRRGR
jgi:hypothetical protein